GEQKVHTIEDGKGRFEGSNLRCGDVLRSQNPKRYHYTKRPVKVSNESMERMADGAGYIVKHDGTRRELGHLAICQVDHVGEQGPPSKQSSMDSHDGIEKNQSTSTPKSSNGALQPTTLALCS